MTNFQVQQANLPQEIDFYQGVNDDYLVQKKEYDKALKKIKGSDFANSPVAYETELTMLKKLIQTAEKQGLTEQLEELKAREQEIYTKISNSALSKGSTPFYKPILAKTLVPQSTLNSQNTGKKEINFNGDPFASFLQHKFEDIDAVKKGITDIYNAGVDKNTTIKILNLLKVTDKETHISKIDAAAMRNIAQMKSVLAQTKNNERLEDENPIKHLNEQIIESNPSLGEHVKFIFRDGNLIYSTPLGGEPSKIEMMKKYKEAVNKEENQFLYDFVNKYKTEDGKIDNKYLRIFMALRQAGVTKDNLFELIDSCIKEDGSFDRKMLSTIGELKKAGVLSKDINSIINAAKDKETGDIDTSYIESAKELTKTIMTGKDVISLLNKANGDQEGYDFLIRFANLFRDPEEKTSCADTVSTLANIAQDQNGNLDQNAMDIVNALMDNKSIFNNNNEITSDVFIDLADKLVNTVKRASVPEGSVNEDATAAIFEMCHQSTKVYDIMKIIHNCLDENNKINPTLAKIAWNMACDSEDTETITEMLKSCHNGEKVDTENASEVLKLFDVYIPDNYEA